jgi:hypothetical protein
MHEVWTDRSIELRGGRWIAGLATVACSGGSH